MHSLVSDLRYAARELRRRPGFTLTAVLSLALGVGATSAVFSVIYAVLIDPFPYAGADRMAQLSLKDKAGKYRYPGLNGAQLEQLRQAKTIESVVAEDGWNLTTTDGDLPEDVEASYVSPNAPNHWGMGALMGRWLIPSDGPMGQEPERVVVLGYKFWQRYFGGDPGIVGRTIQLVHKNYRIVGVMPPRFRWREAAIYLPLKVTLDPNIYLGATLKVRPGVTFAQANAELQPMLEQFAKQSPSRYPDSFRVELRSITDLYAKPMGTTLYLLFGAVASLLLIGCANVSILLLARGAQRQHELAVRAALGAARGRIVRQLLTESLGNRSSGRDAGRLVRLEEPRVYGRLAAGQLVPGGIGDRDEPAGSAVQHRRGGGHRDRVRHLAGAAALAAGRGPGHAGEHAPGDGQCARQAHSSCDGGCASGADAADAHDARARPARDSCGW